MLDKFVYILNEFNAFKYATHKTGAMQKMKNLNVSEFGNILILELLKGLVKCTMLYCTLCCVEENM